MSVRSRVRRAPPIAPELNITAFLNLMVILVPFLLITAVFSSMTILDLHLPPKSLANPNQPDDDKKLNFELIIRKNEIIVADTLNGPISRFNSIDGKEFDMKAVQELLVKLKGRYPDIKNFTILLEPNIPYEILVQAMDAVRVVEENQDGESVKSELFPNISIGDAPEEEVQGQTQGSAN